MHPTGNRLTLFLRAVCLSIGILPLCAMAQSVPADAMLERVVAQLPTKPIQASGTMLVRLRRGLPRQTYAFTLDANWQQPNPTVTYTIKEKNGSPIKSLTFRPHHEQPFTYRSTAELQEAPLPDLTANIAQTDISWMDLTLSFLWWRGADYVGEDTVRGFHCYVIEVPAPETISYPGYAKVRLWISSEQGLLLQAQGFNDTGTPIRRFWVQSVRQIDETWMIQTLEVQQTNLDQRTRLQIDDVKINAGNDL